MHHVLAVTRWPVGGIRTYLRELLRQEALSDIQFTVVMPRTAESSHLTQEIDRQGLRWVLTDNSTSKLFQQTARICSRREFSLLHAHGFTSAMTSLLPARATHLPLLLTAHDVFTTGQYQGWQGRMKRSIVQSFLRRADVIHAVTKDGAENILEYLPGIAQGPCALEVIPHGVDTGAFRDCAPRAVHAELGLDKSKKIFGFFGRFMAQKGFRVLVEAVAQLVQRGVGDRFVIVSVGGGGFVREDTAYIESRGLSRQFMFLPFERHIGPTLKGVDAVVMPSLWEASGLLAMEAMVSGTPLIASSCVGLRETVAGTPARVVPPGDAGALAAAMQDEIDLPSRAASEAFVAAAAARFDARASFSQLRRLYDRMLQTGSRV